MNNFGILTLSKELLCQKEVLGKSYKTKISGHDVEFLFPTLPNDFDSSDFITSNNLLCPPKGFESLNRGGKPLLWGFCVSNNGKAIVKKVLFSFACNNKQEEIINDIYSSINKWESSFIDYCELSTKFVYKNNVDLPSACCTLEMFSNGKFVSDLNPTKLETLPEGYDCYLSYNQICKAFKFKSSGKDLLLEYQLLVSAYRAKEKGRNRQAIIDACSAVELCLEKAIKNCLNQKQLDSEFFLKKYRSLGDKFSLIEKIDKSFSVKNVQNKIVSPRNDVAHNRDVFPDDNKTNNLIRLVEECLNLYYSDFY